MLTKKEEEEGGEEKKRNEFLKHIYFNSKGSLGSFGSIRSLYLAAKKLNPKITYLQVKTFLKGLRTYSQHKRILRKFPRRSYLAFYPHEFWMSDVIYLNPIRKITNKFSKDSHYGVTVCDVFSKKGYVELTRKKSASDVLAAFQKIIKRSKNIPSCLQTDDGKEYRSVFASWCRLQGIKIYSTKTETQKAQIAEIFNYQLKVILNRILTHYRSNSFASYIQQACEIYNNQPSTGLANNMSPNDAEKPENIDIMQQFYLKKRAEFAKKYLKRHPKPNFVVGQKVRKVIKYSQFQTRGFKPRFSEKIFTIDKINKTTPRGYSLLEEKGLQKYYYPQELTAVIESDDTDIPEIEGITTSRDLVTSRTRSGKILTKEKQYLCSFKGETKKKFLPKSEILKYKNGNVMLTEYLSKKNE